MINVKKSMDTIKINSKKFMKKIEIQSKLNTTDKVVILPLKLIKRDVDPFVSLNPVDEGQRIRLEESITKFGFQKSNPVIIWKKKTGKKYVFILIEGFSRCAVCEKLNILEIPCLIKEFASEEEAVAAARYQEYSRRHDDAQSLYKQFEALNLADLKNEPGRLNEIVAKYLGISAHNAHKLLQINAKASDEVKSALREGTISTASAFKSVSAEKKYSVKDNAFLSGVEFCLKQLRDNKSPEEILGLAKDSLMKEAKV